MKVRFAPKSKPAGAINRFAGNAVEKSWPGRRVADMNPVAPVTRPPPLRRYSRSGATSALTTILPSTNTTSTDAVSASSISRASIPKTLSRDARPLIRYIPTRGDELPPDAQLKTSKVKWAVSAILKIVFGIVVFPRTPRGPGLRGPRQSAVR